jgi:hypothetical protein
MGRQAERVGAERDLDPDGVGIVQILLQDVPNAAFNFISPPSTRLP